MKKFTRREIVKTGLAGISAATAGLLFTRSAPAKFAKIDKVVLGETKLKVSRLALGCGNASWARKSKFTKLGLDTFLETAHHAYERGITFLDTADLYGTHPFVKALFKSVPRKNFQLMTKIWTEDNDWNKVVPVQETLDRFKDELGTDYFDILLLHCMVDGNWIEEKREFREKLSEAKARGEIKKVGVSCHNIDALRVAATDPWTDIILARINPLQMRMDGTPDEILEILQTAHRNGKGVIGMKIFGDGGMSTDEQREQSLRFALTHPCVHAMTIGMESPEYVDYSADRIIRMI